MKSSHKISNWNISNFIKQINKSTSQILGISLPNHKCNKSFKILQLQVQKTNKLKRNRNSSFFYSTSKSKLISNSKDKHISQQVTQSAKSNDEKWAINSASKIIPNTPGISDTKSIASLVYQYIYHNKSHKFYNEI